MERRKALAISAAIVATAATGGVAFAANMGLLGFAGGDPAVGNLDARNIAELAADSTAGDTPSTSASTLPEVIVVDEYVDDSTATSDTAGAGSSGSSSGVASVPGSATSHANPSVTAVTHVPQPPPSGDHDDDQYEDDDDHEGEHEGDEDDD